MKFLSYINKFLTKNRKNIIYIVSIVFVFFYLADLSFARDTTATTPQTGTSDKNWVIELINGFLKIASAILGLLTFLVGLFLYPEWTSGSIIGLGGNDGGLKQMWIMISNIVYFVFALIFLWVAFMNVIGKEGEYSLKEALPRFIVGLLMVPFTWFFVQFILSISAILTVGVLSLPYDTFKDTYMKKDDLNKIELCKDYEINVGKQKKDEMPVKCKEGGEKIKLGEILSGKNSDSLYGITAVYTYAIMAVDGNGKITIQDIGDGISDIVSLGVKGIFDLIFVLVYALLMIALALVLFVRGVYLWFYAMLSPLFGLLYFFKKEKEGIGGGKFSLTEFISLAMVPVYVSAALAFGLLFIFSAGNAMKNSSTTPQSGGKPIIEDGGKVINFGGFSYTLKGAVNDGGTKEQIKKLIGGFQGTFGTLILQVFGLAILWMAVMAAINQSKITQTVADPFKQFGDSIGSLAMKAPTYAPILPGGVSAQGLSKVGSTISNIPETRLNQKMAPMLSEIQKSFGGQNTVDPQVKADVAKLLNNGIEDTKELEQLRKIYLEQVQKYGLQDKNVIEMRKQLLEAMKNAKGSAKADLETNYGVDRNLNVDNLNDRKANLALLGRGSGAITDADRLGTALRPGAITGLVDGTTNNSTTQLPTGISKVSDAKDQNKYKVGNTEINITNNGAGLNDKEVGEIAEKLKDTSKINGTTGVDNVLSEMKISNKDVIENIKKKIDDLNKKT
ncbi:hypothetical protein H3C61_04440 [Candidatus Gracilibacteria bacterium]|nr:hypothetical protein [Candidatus Gracilibacteria bacterium]